MNVIVLWFLVLCYFTSSNLPEAPSLALVLQGPPVHESSQTSVLKVILVVFHIPLLDTIIDAITLNLQALQYNNAWPYYIAILVMNMVWWHEKGARTQRSMEGYCRGAQLRVGCVGQSHCDIISPCPWLIAYHMIYPNWGMHACMGSPRGLVGVCFGVWGGGDLF